MERLTCRTLDGEYHYPYCFRDDTCGGMGTSEKCGHCELQNKVCRTLGKYEDTNLTPEQFAEFDKLYLAKCEEVNRLTAELEELKKQQTDYDVKKVTAQLEEYRDELARFGADGILTDMIEVVRGGGK